jgi:hypothetical protein
MRCCYVIDHFDPFYGFRDICGFYQVPDYHFDARFVFEPLGDVEYGHITTLFQEHCNNAASDETVSPRHQSPIGKIVLKTAIQDCIRDFDKDRHGCLRVKRRRSG